MKELADLLEAARVPLKDIVPDGEELPEGVKEVVTSFYDRPVEDRVSLILRLVLTFPLGAQITLLEGLGKLNHACMTKCMATILL